MVADEDRGGPNCDRRSHPFGRKQNRRFARRSRPGAPRGTVTPRALGSAARASSGLRAACQLARSCGPVLSAFRIGTGGLGKSLRECVNSTRRFGHSTRRSRHSRKRPTDQIQRGGPRLQQKSAEPADSHHYAETVAPAVAFNQGFGCWVDGCLDGRPGPATPARDRRYELHNRGGSALGK
jgi:hypothetical protein